MDQEIRNKLRNVVTQCRKLLEDSISQELEGKYGIFAKKDQVTADPNAKMNHLSEEEQAARKDILDHFGHINARGFKPKESLDQLVREIAFTHLNRLCAYKMMEAREVYVGGQKFREAVSRGVNSNGVKFYLAEHEDDERLFNTGHQDVAYRHYLDWLGGALSDEIGVLFNPNDPANRLYPRQKTLDEVLELLNEGGIKAEETELREQWPKIWSQDETIGWVYQYFTPKELRDQARKESSAPRNSYELAFRNQFFTPRYVVEFLTDNTLGRIWYEMRKGDTKLKDQCRYMVRRPTEIFLKDGEQPPKDAAEGKDDLSQEELLKLPVHIPHRPKKDPRELKILDPACGSGHFLLYCFDLLLTIYEEAYSDPELGPAIQKDYANLDDLKRDVPRLILAHNLHGIDIDLRASQIAALALWLRCQRAYQDMGFKKDRPQITRSNFVCAEPMPGEEPMLKGFVSQLEPKVLGQVVEVIFDKMKLAGEAGSLLKIEEEIRDAIREAKRQYAIGGISIQRSLFDKPTEPVVKVFSVKDITDAQFFEGAEVQVIEALRSYAEKAQNGQRLQRRLFTEDAVRGFAFVDLCQKRYDVVLMNPPFGEGSKLAKATIDKQYPRTKNDLYAAFVEQGLNRLAPVGILGAITSRTGFFLTSFQKWREEILLGEATPTVFSDLGYGVLDTAMVETAAYCIEARHSESRSSFFRLLQSDDKDVALLKSITDIKCGQIAFDSYYIAPASFRLVPGSPFAYWATLNVLRLFKSLPPFENEDRTIRAGLQTSDDFRFLRLWWETPVLKLAPSDLRTPVEFISSSHTGARWFAFTKGGHNAPFYSEIYLCINWEHDGQEIKEWVVSNTNDPGTTVWSRNIRSTTFYFRPGITWPARPHLRGAFSQVPAGCIFSHTGPMIFTSDERLWSTIAVLNSDAFVTLLHLLMARGSEGGQTLKYETGYVSAVPLPFIDESDLETLSIIARRAYRYASEKFLNDEVSRRFCLPALCTSPNESLVAAYRTWMGGIRQASTELDSELAKIDEIAFRLYGLRPEDQQHLHEAPSHMLQKNSEVMGNQDEEDDCGGIQVSDCIKSLFSYAIGALFGRWDLRYLASGIPTPAHTNPFAPLPACSPGMLQGDDGYPLVNVPQSYPLRLDADGILVEDVDHQDDILRRARSVLEIIWQKRSDAIEKEACEILGVSALRDYFRKPGKGGFWDDHISRYSKSRRNAPIYWLLQSSKKNYAIWLYYHRLDKDLLFKALVNYVEPKIRLESSRLDTLRSQSGAAGESGKESKRLAKEVEKQEDFLSELRDFEDKLRRAANLHLDPDLNDGVVLNIAPLHELVPWKEAKNYWKELLNGEYEWSSIGKQLRQKGLVK